MQRSTINSWKRSWRSRSVAAGASLLGLAAGVGVMAATPAVTASTATAGTPVATAATSTKAVSTVAAGAPVAGTATARTVTTAHTTTRGS